MRSVRRNLQFDHLEAKKLLDGGVGGTVVLPPIFGSPPVVSSPPPIDPVGGDIGLDPFSTGTDFPSLTPTQPPPTSTPIGPGGLIVPTIPGWVKQPFGALIYDLAHTAITAFGTPGTQP